MDWFKDLYDGYRMKRTFGSVSEEKTEKEVDFIYDICRLYKGAKVLDSDLLQVTTIWTKNPL